MEKNLGHATAYGYAKSKGYSGTEEEFAQLMADYASVGQSAAQSAEQAAASATSASGSAATAAQAAQTATSKASEAVTAADTATTKASEANASADTASAAATSASTSAQTATTAADTATTKASEAAESAATASTAKTDAESARDAAAQSASEAAESARTLTIDATLTQSGQAADAKEVGDRIKSIDEDLGKATKSFEIDYTEGGYINSDKPGDVKESTGWKYTDYIDVSGNDGFIYCSMVNGSGEPTVDGSSYNAWYNADKSYNSRLKFVGNKIKVPDGAVYLRLSCRRAYTQTVSIVIYGLLQQAKDNKNIDANYIRIGTWNVGIFKDGTNKPTTEEAPAQIAKLRTTVGEMNADILSTQEWVDAVDVANTISSLNLLSFKYGSKTMVGANKSYSKFGIFSGETITFLSGSNRLCKSFTINFHGKELTIINYHGAIQLDPTEYRDADVAQLITYMQDKEYCILTGDFNVASDAEYDAFVNAGFTICNGGLFGWFDTWPVMANMWDGFTPRWPCRHLDNIIVSSNITPQYVKTVESGISDHAPLVAVLRID